MDEQQHETAVTGFLEKLKNRGLRLTAQREVLFRVIAENIGIPSTVQDIWGKTRDLDPSIGIATVYRTINLLSEMGVVNVIYLNEGSSGLRCQNRSSTCPPSAGTADPSSLSGERTGNRKSWNNGLGIPEWNFSPSPSPLPGCAQNAGKS
jgi:hypothetical protein